LQSVGRPLGVLELATDGNIDLELAAHAAPLIATRAAMLLAVGVGGLAPPAGGDADDAEISAAIRTFAAQAKHVLDHDRLSAYLVSLDGRAVERFAVATSQTLPDEGIIVPFAEFGLRHILVSNRGLVSADLGTDARIVGREDRVIAQAGFHGLVSVPLRLQGEAFGVLNFVSRARGFYTEQDVAVAQQIADQAAAFFAVLRRQRRTRIWMMHSAAEHERARLARELHDTLVRALPQVGDHVREIDPTSHRSTHAWRSVSARSGARSTGSPPTPGARCWVSLRPRWTRTLSRMSSVPNSTRWSRRRTSRRPSRCRATPRGCRLRCGAASTGSSRRRSATSGSTPGHRRSRST
jgi:hypothetical protein